MQIKADQYDGQKGNQQIRNNIIKFKENYPVYREISDDGNSFYRAFIFSFFEQKIQQCDTEYFDRLIKDINLGKIDFACIQQNSIPRDLVQFVKDKQISEHFKGGLYRIKDIINNNSSFVNKIEQLQSLFNDYVVFDMVCILFSRYQALEIKKENLIDLRAQYMNKEEETHQLIVKYGQEAQNAILSFAAEAFNCDIIIHALFREQQQEYIYSPVRERPGKQKVNLLFKPGHYDLCYDNNHIRQYDKPNLQNQNININNNSIENINRNNQQYQKRPSLRESTIIQNQNQAENTNQQPKNDKNVILDGQLIFYQGYVYWIYGIVTFFILGIIVFVVIYIAQSQSNSKSLHHQSFNYYDNSKTTNNFSNQQTHEFKKLDNSSTDDSDQISLITFNNDDGKQNIEIEDGSVLIHNKQENAKKNYKNIDIADNGQEEQQEIQGSLDVEENGQKQYQRNGDGVEENGQKQYQRKEKGVEENGQKQDQQKQDGLDKTDQKQKQKHKKQKKQKNKQLKPNQK